MSEERQVFQSVNVDHDVDGVLRAQAAAEGKEKSAVFMEYLKSGMARAKRRKTLPVLPDRSISLSVRGVYLPASLHEDLRAMAYQRHTGFNDLIRQYLRLGMEQHQKASQRT